MQQHYADVNAVYQEGVEITPEQDRILDLVEQEQANSLITKFLSIYAIDGKGLYFRLALKIPMLLGTSVQALGKFLQSLLNLRPQTPQYSNLILIARKQSEEMQQDKKK